MAVLLPAYLLVLGHTPFEVGVIGTVTLAGSAMATLAVGAWGHRAPPRTLLLGAALLMAATGLGFAFTIDENNNRATTAVPANWTVPATACWVRKKGGIC